MKKIIFFYCLYVLIGCCSIGNTAVTPKVIYGTDNRLDVFEETDQTHLEQSRSVCGLLSKSDLIKNGDGTYTILTSQFTYGGLPPCEGEPFADQPTAPWCTGFLVGQDLIATAGHCYDEKDLGKTRFVFGFIMENAKTARTIVNSSQVYKGIEIVKRLQNRGFDFAIIRLDRQVNCPGANPLLIRKTGVVPLYSQVGVIGHASSLPLKIAFGSETIVRKNKQIGFFEANLDTFGGNSGSPVFNNETGLVEGILVAGKPDFNIQGHCFFSDILPDYCPSTEKVSTAISFAHFIPGLCSPANITIDPMGLDFSAPIGKYKIKRVFLSHQSDCSVALESAKSSNSQFRVIFPIFPQTLEPDEELEIVVIFCPEDTVPQAGELNINLIKADQDKLVIPLNGQGFEP